MTTSSRTCGQQPEASVSGPVALSIEVRRHPLVAHVQRQLRFRCRLEGSPGSEIRLVLGVSGGADSSALLLSSAAIARHGLADGVSLIPIAVHVNHHLRDSADEDAAWVDQLCRDLGIESHIEHVRPADRPGNLAANARQDRYAALSGAARRVDSRHIAVAHHGDDQFETILMALCRGSGLDGLSGMSWRRELEPGIWLLRPMLESRRADAESLCEAGGIRWREDPGNLDPNSARARIRHEVAPILESLWSDAARRVTATGDLVDAARQALESQLQSVFGEASARSWARTELAGLPAAILASGLRRAALNEAPDASDEIGQKHLAQAAEAILDDQRKPRAFDWPRGLQVIITSSNVELRRMHP